MIILDMSDKRPLYEQVRDRFIELIEHGILLQDEQLPSIRALSIELSINPNTIQRAYAELERNGYAYSVKGRGSFVANISGLLPERVKDFYNELDALLIKAKTCGLGPIEIKQHIDEYMGN